MMEEPIPGVKKKTGHSYHSLEMERLEEEDERNSVSPWKNIALEICEREMGLEKFTKRIEKYKKNKPSGFASKTRLSYEIQKLKKLVRSRVPSVLAHNAVGASGYASVLRNLALPETEFFSPGKRYRVRVRHNAVCCKDDAASCCRQVAIKFADQNEDGPLDLVLNTGRTALPRHCKALVDILGNTKPEDVKNRCHKDPYFYYSLVDGLRRAPSSYAHLQYHSQSPYRFTAKDGQPRLAKFRLVPFDRHQNESGQLSAEDQTAPWNTEPRGQLGRHVDYLRQEFIQRLKEEPVKYILQIQVRKCQKKVECDMWDSQQIWSDEEYPWLDLIELYLTTVLPRATTSRTYFNPNNLLPCLQFDAPDSIWDLRSLPYALVAVASTFEIDRINQGVSRHLTEAGDVDTVSYSILVCTQPSKQTRTKLQIFITIIGTNGRTIPHRLCKKIEGEKASEKDEEINYYQIKVENVGELLAVIISIRHRNLMDDWFLKYVSVSNLERTKTRHFPCHNFVHSKITLCPGDVKLPCEETHELQCQERMLELRDKHLQYEWRPTEQLPSTMKACVAKDLPVGEQMYLEKYHSLPWEIDSALNLVSQEATIKRDDSKGSMRKISSQSSFDGSVQNTERNPSTRRRSSEPGMILRRQSLTVKAQVKWSRLKMALHFISQASAKLPEGPKGEICRTVTEDVDFGRRFTHGPNPCVLRQCMKLPDKIILDVEQIETFLERNVSFEQEMKVGHIFIADYSLLDNIDCQSGRFVTAPVCLLYLQQSGNLTPIAIQLGQAPDHDNPVWTPNDKADDWLLAKLWVMCADFHYQLASHLLHCHLIMEVFAMATVRQLSSCHPIYKLLHPHLRYIIPGNFLLRNQVLRKGGAADKWTSLGRVGLTQLMRRMYQEFTMDDLDLPIDLLKRGVCDAKKLPTYYFRDDGLPLWEAINSYVSAIVDYFYTSDDMLVADNEMQAWLADIKQYGLVRAETCDPDSMGLPLRLAYKAELQILLSRLLFTCTCRHAATHREAMDMYAHEPQVPASMHQPPPTVRGETKRNVLSTTLPDQDSRGYNAAVAFVMSKQKAEPNALGQMAGSFFVETKAKDILEEFQRRLTKISVIINTRNLKSEFPYELLLPENISNNPELFPFMPDAEPHEEEYRRRSGDVSERRGSQYAPSVPLLALPLCMSWAKSYGGNSMLGRRMSLNVFSQAMSGVQMDRVNVPVNAIQGRHFPMSRIAYGQAEA